MDRGAVPRISTNKQQMELHNLKECIDYKSNCFVCGKFLNLLFKISVRKPANNTYDYYPTHHESIYFKLKENILQNNNNLFNIKLNINTNQIITSNHPYFTDNSTIEFYKKCKTCHNQIKIRNNSFSYIFPMFVASEEIGFTFKREQIFIHKIMSSHKSNGTTWIDFFKNKTIRNTLRLKNEFNIDNAKSIKELYNKLKIFQIFQ